MTSLAHSLFLLLQAAGDSAGTRIVVEHSWLDTLANIAQSLVSVLVMVMLVMGVLLLYALRRSIDELSKLIKSSYEPLRGALTEVREVTGEVRAIVKSLKAPVTLAGQTMDEASTRVKAAMSVAEGRLARLDTLVGIAQEEVEDVVVGAASLLRGVSAGGRAAGRSLGLRRRGGAAATRELAPVDDVGPDERDDHDALDPREAPRIRSRAGARR